MAKISSAALNLKVIGHTPTQAQIIRGTIDASALGFAPGEFPEIEVTSARTGAKEIFERTGWKYSGYGDDREIIAAVYTPANRKIHNFSIVVLND